MLYSNSVRLVRNGDEEAGVNPTLSLKIKLYAKMVLNY